MTKLYRPALIKLMVKREQEIKKLKTEFLSNEVNDLQTLEIWLEEAYCNIRPVYKEIMNRYSKPLEKTIPSKINLEKSSSGRITYQWEL